MKEDNCLCPECGTEMIVTYEKPPLQTLNDFYKGHSIPVNEKLSEMFLQLHISEKTGRGIPTITSIYGNESIDISDGTIVVTIPFNRINNMGDKAGDKVGDKVGDKSLNISQIKVLAEIRNNPNITKPELMIKCSLGKTSIDNIILFLKKNSFIERIGSNKTGYWKVKWLFYNTFIYYKPRQESPRTRE